MFHISPEGHDIHPSHDTSENQGNHVYSKGTPVCKSLLWGYGKKHSEDVEPWSLVLWLPGYHFLFKEHGHLLIQDLSTALPHLGKYGDDGESLRVTAGIIDEAQTLMAILYRMSLVIHWMNFVSICLPAEMVALMPPSHR